MQFSFIVPTKHINSLGIKSDFILALSHLIDLEKENEYEKNIKATKLLVMLDNGVFERHKPEALDALIDKAVKIRAFVFYSPDYLYDARKTEEQIDITYEKMKEKNLLGKIRLGAVVQGNNREEWIEQYVAFTQDERISIIGLSILSIPHAYKLPITKARVACLKDLVKLSVKHKYCHLLGLGDSYDDVKFAIKYCPWVKSNDTSSCFMSGLKGKAYTNDMRVPGGKIKEKMNFNLKQLSPLQKAIIEDNIRKVKELK
jgi:hypothetical protein